MKHLILFIGIMTSGNLIAQVTIRPQLILKHADIETILGQSSSFISQKDSIGKNGFRAFRSSYIGIEDDVESTVYFTFLKFETEKESSAQMTDFLDSNKESKGFELVKDIGFFHFDLQNFHLLVIQKKNVLLTIKVKNISNKTKKENLIRIGTVAHDRI